MHETNHLLITGASRGIGAATALLAAQRGHDITINYVADRRAADDVAQAVRQLGRRAAVIQADVGKPEDVIRLFSEAENALGPVSGLVNNVGITGPIGPFSRTTDATIERVFQVNVYGVMRCCRQAVQRFTERNHPGVIVNVSSVAATTGSPNEYIHYAASKAAVETFTLGLAKEVARTGVRVCGVAPGTTLTDIHTTAGEPGRPDRVAPNIPMGRVGRPEEIAEAIVWLLSPAASYMTGNTLQCAGGLGS